MVIFIDVRFQGRADQTTAPVTSFAIALVRPVPEGIEHAAQQLALQFRYR